MKKSALIILDGTMKGAYTVGILRVFYEKLGLNYFDSIYSFSVGIFEQAFFVANQPETMENTWRNYVSGSKLINPFNVFRGKAILDLDYLTGLFQTEMSLLNIKQMLISPINIYCFVTDHSTRLPVILNLKEGENIFDIMRASCAVPLLYPPVKIGNKKYIDGVFACKKKIMMEIKRICDRFDEIIVISNSGSIRFLPTNPKIKLIRPSDMPLWHPLDTNRSRIIKTIEQGKMDALEFLQNQG
jgi:predicted patatin/cPLA2 family phospholipase